MGIKTTKNNSFAKRLTFVGFAMLFFFWVYLIYQAYASHNKVKSVELDKLKLISTSLADNLALDFDSVKLTLEAVAEKHFYSTMFSENINSDLKSQLEQWLKNNKRISGLMLSDASGAVKLFITQAGNTNWLKKTANIGNKDYFLFHTYSFNSKAQSEYISQISNSNTTNSDLLVFSKPIKDIDNNFDGVIAAFVDTKYYSNYAKSLGTAIDANLAVALNSNEIFMLSSKNNDTEEFINNIKNNIDNVSNTTPVFVLDGKEHLTNFKQIGQREMHLIISTDEANIYAQWKKERVYDLIFLILFTLFSIIAYLLLREMKKQVELAEVSAKKALAASQSKSEFLAKMSHELRTPLNAIIGFSEMIDTGYFGDLNTKQSERIQDINLCGKHLLHVINDILDYSKGDAGKLELFESEVQINTLINDSVLMLRDRAISKNVVLEINALHNLPKISVDERKIRQIILNLLSNSLKFTEEGGHININVSHDSKRNLEIEIKDNGIGMNEEELKVALSAFGQSKNKYSYEGTGLGLPLSQMLAELHGGSIALQSKTGVGTSAILILPHYRVL